MIEKIIGVLILLISVFVNILSGASFYKDAIIYYHDKKYFRFGMSLIVAIGFTAIVVKLIT